MLFRSDDPDEAISFGLADALVGRLADERMANRMMYGRLNYHLPIALPREKRSELAAVLRRYRMVKAVLVDEKQVRIWYAGTLPAREIQQQIIAVVQAAQEAAVTPAERLAEYRRDALVSLAGFAAVQILRKTSPELFAATKIARSLLTVFLARKFITNGIRGPLKEHEIGRASCRERV